ncbi:MAG: hypothetical protein P4L27_12255 [Ignavibacteriaceae bacterium]|nr:hypothetical protein [Ignavibacteriaceae bacterium]
MKYLVVFLLLQFLIINNYCLQAQWVQTNSGVIYCLALSGNNIFAGSSRGVFLSTDNGENWKQVNNNNNVQAFAVSGINIFAGTGSGVLLSTNNGEYWMQVNNGLTNTTITSFAVSGTNILAGTANGVFLSENNGKNWTKIGIQIKHNDNSLTPKVVFFSKKNGEGQPTKNRLIQHNDDVLSIQAKGNDIFACIKWTGTYFSNNNGTSWEKIGGWKKISDGLPIDSFVECFHLGGNNILAGTGSSNNFLSTNNGTSWTEVKIGLNNISLKCLTVSGNNVFVGADPFWDGIGGIYLSINNGISWSQVGLTYNNVNAISVSESYVFAAGADGFWRRPLAEILGVQKN